MLLENPQPDRRRDMPTAKYRASQAKDDKARGVGQADSPNRALWALFAGVKYWSAKTNGPRADGQRPGDLKRAAELFRDAMEATWRAGFKGEDLADELLRQIKRS